MIDRCGLFGQQSRPVEYLRKNGFQEFDADVIIMSLPRLSRSFTRDCGVSKIRQIAFTGQAGIASFAWTRRAAPCMHAISRWDER